MVQNKDIFDKEFLDNWTVVGTACWISRSCSWRYCCVSKNGRLRCCKNHQHLHNIFHQRPYFEVIRNQGSVQRIFCIDLLVGGYIIHNPLCRFCVLEDSLQSLRTRNRSSGLLRCANNPHFRGNSGDASKWKLRSRIDDYGHQQRTRRNHTAVRSKINLGRCRSRSTNKRNTTSNATFIYHFVALNRRQNYSPFAS